MKDKNLLCVRHFNSNRFERVKTIPFEWNQFKVHLENKSTNLLEIGIFLIFQKVPCLKRSVVQNTLYQELLQLLLCLKISLVLLLQLQLRFSKGYTLKNMKISIFYRNAE
ncbi:Hypothetical_protein [Hexamita inflata]|uniref:Hypothetical_protein n=1 Tax=Hexamita inflata TaxID=28002 RepID=A0AA86U2U9_9EUKA|nr:Hypothetical protein HINF_LOCUS27690 [Hexamita inflata]CAI9950268.1 Hypothetical protein HINF_LOCUS37913 [Hexamita inflata]